VVWEIVEGDTTPPDLPLSGKVEFDPPDKGETGGFILIELTTDLVFGVI
jgi:hypothetical protein